MEKPKLKPTNISTFFDCFKPKEKREKKTKVTKVMGFRCDSTTRQEILRLSKKAEITPSEWITLVVEDAIKNKVEVSKVTVLSIKYNTNK